MFETRAVFAATALLLAGCATYPQPEQYGFVDLQAIRSDRSLDGRTVRMRTCMGIPLTDVVEGPEYVVLYPCEGEADESMVAKIVLAEPASMDVMQPFVDARISIEERWQAELVGRVSRRHVEGAEEEVPIFTILNVSNPSSHGPLHPPSPRETTMPTSDASAAASFNLMPVTQWPLRFDSHSFSVKCYDTYGCTVDYAGLEQWGDEPDEYRPSSESYGPDYQRNWDGMHGMIRNFPSPAKVRWRSKDGEPHEAEIDIAALFADEVVRHRVPREEVADMVDGKYRSEPSIILEVNDRTIRVWMRARIPLKKQVEIAGVMRNDRRYDLILVETYTF